MGRKPKDVDTNLLIQDYLAGMSVNKLEEKYKLNQTAILVRLKKAGVYKPARVYINNIINNLTDVYNKINKYSIDADDKNRILELIYKIISALNNK